MQAEVSKLIRRTGQQARDLHIEQVTSKAPLDYVTNIDRQLDSTLTAALTQLTPGIEVLSEEGSHTAKETAGQHWLIDPLDGTHNLIAGLPFTAISIALLEGSKTVLAAVYDIHHDDVYFAEQGKGASFNEAPFRLADNATKLIGLSSGALKDLLVKPHLLTSHLASFKNRNFGAQALHLCYVASGRLGGAISSEARLWDDAAGRLIAGEAGADYISLNGQNTQLKLDAPQRSICSHPDHSQALCAMMQQVWPPQAEDSNLG